MKEGGEKYEEYLELARERARAERAERARFELEKSASQIKNIAGGLAMMNIYRGQQELAGKVREYLLNNGYELADVSSGKPPRSGIEVRAKSGNSGVIIHLFTRYGEVRFDPDDDNTEIVPVNE